MGKQGERQPRTEWAGMTDWVQAKVKPRTKQKRGGQKQGRERRWRKTEWAGMTD